MVIPNENLNLYISQRRLLFIMGSNTNYLNFILIICLTILVTKDGLQQAIMSTGCVSPYVTGWSAVIGEFQSSLFLAYVRKSVCIIYLSLISISINFNKLS